MSFSKKDVSSEPGGPRTVLTDKGPTEVLSDYHKYSLGGDSYSVFPFECFYRRNPYPYKKSIQSLGA